MDLKNNKITVEELLKNERAKKVLIKHFPVLLKNEKLFVLFKGLTLSRVINTASGHVDKKQIDACMHELLAL